MLGQTLCRQLDEFLCEGNEGQFVRECSKSLLPKRLYCEVANLGKFPNPHKEREKDKIDRARVGEVHLMQT